MRESAHELQIQQAPGPGARALRLGRIPLYRTVLPLLAAIVALATGGVVLIAYLGARSEALTAAQASAQTAVAVERDVLSQHGPVVEQRGSQLVLPTGATTYNLNNDSTVVDRTRALTGAFISIYELEGNRLVTISTNVPNSTNGRAVTGTRALGVILPADAYTALVGTCGATADPVCHHSYSGTISVRGSQYVMAIQPLFNASGVFVGALGAALPQQTVLHPVAQLVVLLVMVGLLVALIALVGGSWLLNRISGRLLTGLDEQLREVATIASELEHTAHRQVARAERQDQIARSILEQARSLDKIATAIRQDQSMLQSSTGELWAEVSHPGAMPDSEITMQLARQTAVAAARTGTSASDAQMVSRRVVAMLNHIMAEGQLIAKGGNAIRASSHALRESIESVEMTLGQRLVHRVGILPLPLLRGVWRTRTAPREQHAEMDTGATAPTARVVIPGAKPATTGQHPRARKMPSDSPRFIPRSAHQPEVSGTRRAPGGTRPHPPRDAHPKRSSDSDIDPEE